MPTPSSQRADQILADAEAHITEHGYDSGFVVAVALEALAEQWSDDDRPLCPACGKRRMGRGESQCLWCKQTYEAQLVHKINWWRKNGQDWRVERRAAQ